MATPPSSVPGASERVDVRVSAAVRSDSGVSFGTLRWVAGEQVLIEVDTDLAAGDAVEIRVDLSPTPGTALARCTNIRQLATTQGETCRYVLRIGDMPAEDRGRWLSWLRTIRRGGTLSDFGMLSTGSDPIAGGQAQASAAEVRAALGGMDSRRSGQVPHSNTSVSSTRSDPYGNRSDVKEAGAGRAAMREALRKALSGQVPATPTTRTLGGPMASTPAAVEVRAPVEAPTASPAPYPGIAPNRPSPMSTPPRTGGPAVSTTPPASAWRTPAVAAPVAAPVAAVTATPTPSAAPALTPSAPLTTDPSYSMSTAAGATYLEVKWASADQFGYDVHSQLTRGVLHLQAAAGPTPANGDVMLLLRHAALFLQCRACVVESSPLGITMRVSLTPGDVETVRHAARPTSTISTIRSTPPKR